MTRIPLPRLFSSLTGLAVVVLSTVWITARGTMPVFLGEILLGALGLAVANQFVLLADQALRWSKTRSFAYGLTAVIALASAGVLISAYEQLPILLTAAPVYVILAAALLSGSILLLIFLTVGTGLGSFVLLCLAYAQFGHLLPGAVASRARDPSTLVVLLGIDDTAILGIALQVGFEIAIAFLLFGRLLESVGAAAFFSDMAASVMGGFRGGAAKISILASTFFGTISGNAVANVMSTGALTIPMMRKSGFRSHSAAAVEAVSSTGGQLTPPVMGVTAFLMAEMLEVPYTSVALAALLPAVLYYIAVFLHVDLSAARSRIEGIPKLERPRFGHTFAAGWHFLVPPLALVFGLIVLRWEPGFSALAATMLLVAIGLLRGYKGQRARGSGILSGLVTAGRDSCAILIITAAAGMVIGVLSITGAAFELTYLLDAVGGNSIFLLLITTAAACILLGMGMPTVSAYVILASLLAPSLVAAGVTELQAHMFILYFGTLSMLTPPVALAAFVAAKLSGSRPLRAAWESMLLSWPAYVVPFLFVQTPALLLLDEPPAVIASFLMTTLAILALTTASVGYFLAALAAGERLLLAGLGIVLLLPLTEWSGAGVLVKAAATGGLLLTAWQLRRKSLASDATG